MLSSRPFDSLGTYTRSFREICGRGKGGSIWIFTRHGFFSVVCARKEQGDRGQDLDHAVLIVRARLRGHLKALKRRFPEELGGAEIRAFQGTDYACRIFVEKPVWVRVVSELAGELDYGNFKSEVARSQGSSGKKYEAALHEVWAAMYGIQDSK